MKNIPLKTRYLIYSICLLIFILLSMGFGIRLMVRVSNMLLSLTGYFFAFSHTNLDYLFIALTPFFGMIINSKRKTFNSLKLIKDICIVLLSVVITFGIGLYIMTLVGKPENHLIPQYIVNTPFDFYITLFIMLGLIAPLVIKKSNI